MKRLFAVIRSYGGAWQASQPIEGQVAWDSHAAFMNALEKKGLSFSEGRSRARLTFYLLYARRHPTKSSSSSQPIPGPASASLA